jgi:hypothetical protein
MENHSSKRPIGKMSNKEIRQTLRQRALMFSWVAYLDEEGENVQAKYLSDALSGIDKIEAEIIKREMTVVCH